jgi:hypothetical protein
MSSSTSPVANSTRCPNDGALRRAYLQQFRESVRTVGEVRDDELDPAFRSRLLDAFKDFR